MAHVNLHHARTDFQRAIMQRIQKDKVCPFCEEHFLKYHTKPVIKKGKYWILTENFQPYTGTKHHLLAVSRRHVQSFEELKAPAQSELFKLFAAEAKKRNIKGGGIFMRFGSSDFSGGTVEHLHAQLISGGKRDGKKKPILTALAYER